MLEIHHNLEHSLNYIHCIINRFVRHWLLYWESYWSTSKFGYGDGHCILWSCQLSWCVTASEALIVVLESTRTDIEKALVEICDVKMKLDFVTIPDNQDWGTADSLRHISDRIKVRWRQSVRGSVRPRRFWHGAAPCPRFVAPCFPLPVPAPCFPFLSF